MPKLTVYKQTGEKHGQITVSDAVFGIADANIPLVHQAVVAQLNNARQGTKSTLTRTEVRGGGIKPWRQKGTGRARQGSIRAPQWIKGGVVFAPKPRDFSQKMNKQAKKSALAEALSSKVKDDVFVVIDEFKLNAIKTEHGLYAKTKEAAKIAADLKLTDRTLVILTSKDEALVWAAKNIPNLKTINAEFVNVYDVVAAAKCVATVEAVKQIEENYAEKAEKPAKAEKVEKPAPVKAEKPAKAEKPEKPAVEKPAKTKTETKTEKPAAAKKPAPAKKTEAKE